MAQLIKVICLTEEQVENTLDNMCSLRGLNKPKKIYEGKPKYSQELSNKYNIPFITKFADKYTCYLADAKSSNEKTKQNNLTVSTSAENNLTEGFIVIYADKVDVWNISASAALYYEHFLGKINPNGYPPKLTILPAFTVSKSLMSHYKEDIIPDCNYRIFSLIEVYPLIGSKDSLFKLTYNYKIHNYEKSFNGKEYSIIYDKDPIVKIFNGVPHQLITCNALAFDDSVFSQTYIREIKESNRKINKISPSGICLHKDFKLIE